MAQEVIINCGEGSAAYKTHIIGRNLDMFVEAVGHPDVEGKEGEALVAAIFSVVGDGVKSIERRNKYGLNDGPNGEPALELFTGGECDEAQSWVCGMPQGGLYNKAKIGKGVDFAEIGSNPETFNALAAVRKETRADDPVFEFVRAKKMTVGG